MNDSQDTSLRLVVGLGNPGEEYVGSRHNAGFAAIDLLADKLRGKPAYASLCRSHIWNGTLCGKNLMLQKPMTYMNRSGEAVARFAKSERIPPREILVVHDDMDLPLGRIRIKRAGGSAGHNGINSIIESLGTDDFLRLRVGIGKMANGHGSAAFVLAGFSPCETPVLLKVLHAAVDAVQMILRRGLSFAMTSFNGCDFTPEEPLDSNVIK